MLFLISQSWNMWIPPQFINVDGEKNFNVLLLNLTFILGFFSPPWLQHIQLQPHLCWWVNHYFFSAEQENPFFPMAQKEGDTIWTPQVSGWSLLRPCSLLLWGHQKIWSVHSSFSQWSTLSDGTGRRYLLFTLRAMQRPTLTHHVVSCWQKLILQ